MSITDDVRQRGSQGRRPGRCAWTFSKEGGIQDSGRHWDHLPRASASEGRRWVPWPTVRASRSIQGLMVSRKVGTAPTPKKDKLDLTAGGVRGRARSKSRRSSRAPIFSTTKSGSRNQKWIEMTPARESGEVPSSTACGTGAMPWLMGAALSPGPFLQKKKKKKKKKKNESGGVFDQDDAGMIDLPAGPSISASS